MNPETNHVYEKMLLNYIIRKLIMNLKKYLWII